VTGENPWYQDLGPTAADEAHVIVSEYAEHGIKIGGVPGPADQGDRDTDAKGAGFMYAEGQILALQQYLDEIRETLRPHHIQVEVVKRVVRGVMLLRLSWITEELPDSNEVRSESNDVSAEDDKNSESNETNPEGNEKSSVGNDGDGAAGDGTAGDDGKPPRGNGGDDYNEPPSVLKVLDYIDEALGVGVATPDHVVTVAGDMAPCPATEPQEVYGPQEPFPPFCRGEGGAGVRIYIADTGLLKNATTTFPWLNGVNGEPDPRIGTGGVIKPYAGHGTFVAGVVRCMAPKAEIYVANVFNIAGSALESHFVPKLNKAFDFGFEILHLTIASPTRKNHPMLALGTWLELLHSYKGVVCVVAAGNNDTRRPSWPAAFPGTISVGALAADWRSRAYFSNYGGWVNVYAPGQNLINAYASGKYTCKIAPYAGEIRTFSGLAQWSGTSFSTPIVTGLIAARMARCGESGKEAAAALLAEARAQTIPGVGPVLLPCCDDEDGNCCGHDRGGRGDCGCGRGGSDGCGGHGRGGRGHCGCGHCRSGHDRPGCP
jgi:hypothetical protein